jgi:hypothetical protein
MPRRVIELTYRFGEKEGYSGQRIDKAHATVRPGVVIVERKYVLKPIVG